MSNEELPAPIIDDGNGNGENDSTPRLQEWIEEAERTNPDPDPDAPPAK